MTLRPWVAAALGLSTLAAWSPAAPGPTKYKLEVKTKITQDLTAIGQGSQTQELSNTGFVTVTERDSGAVRLVNIVVDSLQAGPGSPTTPEQLASVAGSKWHGTRNATGRLDSLVLEGDNPVAATLESLLRTLFPPLKKGTAAGTSWTDTTDAEGMLGVPIRTVTNLVTSADTWQGAKVMKLTGASATAISGTVQSPQGQLQIDGTGTGSIAWVIGNDGTLLNGTATSTSNMTVSIAVAPAPIPISVDVSSTTTLLK
ncbi:MAG TPA: hypothetical protein VG817_12985 [Gemmatimonadales bacterium]|nr:hypothetical protein [Gemmatimonadales bacterium]